MANDFVKRFVKKDGSQRISFYRDEYAENPRDMTDEPLHCCDWSRHYSIKTKDDPSYSDARSLINQMLVWYGKREVIIDALCKGIENNRLEYTRKENEWKEDKSDIPCWSLAALLEILAKIASKIDDDGSANLSSFMGQWSVNMFDCPVEATDNYDNPVDACVAMIEKLNELKLL